MAQKTRALILQLDSWNGYGSSPIHTAWHYVEGEITIDRDSLSWGRINEVPLCSCRTYCEIDLNGQLRIECNCGLRRDSGRSAGRAFIPQAILAAFMFNSVVPTREIPLDVSRARAPLGRIISFVGMDAKLHYAFGGMTMYNRAGSTSCRLFVSLPFVTEPFTYYLPWALEEYLLEVNRVQKEASLTLRGLFNAPC